MFKFFKKILAFFTINPEIKNVVECIGARRLAIKVARKRPTKVPEMIKYLDTVLGMNACGLDEIYLMTVRGIIKEIDGDPLLRSDFETIMTLVRVNGKVDVSKFRNFLIGFRQGLSF